MRLGGEKVEKQLKQLSFKVKVVDQENRVIEMIGSDESNDRAGDKMLLAGAKLDNFKKNPVIVANHNYGQSEKPTVIGRALSITIEKSQMIFKIQFAETENGKEWFYLYANKYMNASSIGFIPIDFEPNSSGGYDFKTWELLELSLISVPCNPNAVQRAYKSGKISKGIYEQIKELEVLDMNVKELEALVEKSVSGSVKTLQAKHAKEIKALNAKIKAMEDAPAEDESTEDEGSEETEMKDICDAIGAQLEKLRALCGEEKAVETGDEEGAPTEDEAKDYSEEEIQKMVADNIEKMMKEAK